jgi:hypothetical protein
MNDPKKKVQIVNVNLDINLEDEIKKHSIIDASTKNKIINVLDVNRQKDKKPINPVEQMWGEKFSRLFDEMTKPDISMTKDAMTKILEIPVLELAAAIARFKKFLRVSKSNQWVILTGQDNKRERIYTLKKFS